MTTPTPSTERKKPVGRVCLANSPKLDLDKIEVEEVYLVKDLRVKLIDLVLKEKALEGVTI